MGWYSPWGEEYDLVYMSKVFSFSPDFEDCVNAKKVIRGGQDIVSLTKMEKSITIKT